MALQHHDRRICRRGRAVVQTGQANLQMYSHRVMGAFSLYQRKDLDHAGGSPFLQCTNNQDVRVACATQLGVSGRFGKFLHRCFHLRITSNLTCSLVIHALRRQNRHHAPLLPAESPSLHSDMTCIESGFKARRIYEKYLLSSEDLSIAEQRLLKPVVGNGNMLRPSGSTLFIYCKQ